MQYLRLSEGFNNYNLIPESEDIWKHIKTNDKDYYVSLFSYNDDHYNQWKKTKTISGIKDTTTNKLFFDFDDSTNIQNAKTDAVTLVSRLLASGIPQDKIQITFSGNKGFGVGVDTTSKFTPDEFKNVVFSLASDLKTFDKVVNDPNRIVRVVGTKHNKSGLYKIPLSLAQLTELNVEQIKDCAKSLDNVDMDIVKAWKGPVSISESIETLKVETKKEKEVIKVDHDLDMSKKPRWLSEAKYALQEGFFGAGERNTAFMVLGSTYKNQGFPKEIVYRMLKGVAEIQANRNSQERYSDTEIYNNIVEQIFSPTWKGGSYSYENTPLLQDVTKRLGLKVVTEEESPLVEVSDVSSIFKKFATDIDKNTMKLGIEPIDREIRVTTSMLVELLAAPSAGKTSVSLNVLNSSSLNNIDSAFFSLDMGAPLVYQRLIQKHTGFTNKRLFEIYKNNEVKEIDRIQQIVKQNYGNVKFCFRSGITPTDMDLFITEQQEKTGRKVKLMVVDYLENIVTPYSDPTASTGYAAQFMKDLANKHEMTVLLLVQPQKHAGDPSSELLSMRNIKGSGQIEQAGSVIFTMWRPGFGPKKPEEDKFLSIAVVKNRMGSLGKFDFAWDGLKGSITELDDEGKIELETIIKRKIQERAESNAL